MNLLIIRLSSMGDVIHVLPALRALRATFPEATLGWVVEDSHAPLLSGLSEIDRLYLLPRKKVRGTWSERRKVVRDLKTRLREVSWDLAIDFQGLWKSWLVARWSGAKRIAGYWPSPERTHWLYTDPIRLPSMDRHAVDRNLDLLAALGVSTRAAESRSDFPRDFRLPITPHDRAAARGLLAELGLLETSPKVLLNFSARKGANRWGDERFAELAARLLEKGVIPVLTGGPDDREEELAIQSHLREPVPSLVGKCSLLELAAIMENFDAIVTGDTGPMHVAVSAGLPLVAVFGPANPVRTGPYSPQARVLQKPRDCQPCYGRECKFGATPALCLQDIEVEEVLAEVIEILRSAPR